MSTDALITTLNNLMGSRAKPRYSLVRVPGAGQRAFINVLSLLGELAIAGRDYIILGGTNCTLEHHTKPSSLDYWLRLRFPLHQDILLADKQVAKELVATGCFRTARYLRCPDDGRLCRGLRLTEAGSALTRQRF
ncbi:MAG: hypothetical protein ACYC6L_10035 [Anaerolineae bacterium]